MIEFIGYACAILIGVSLGLIGGGGSILTVPVLVYLMGISPVLATAYSLFIVGSAALIGSIRYAKQQLVDFKTAAVFGIPSIIAVYLTRRFLVPAIPETVIQFDSYPVSKDMLMMVLFALLMLAASITMIKPSKPKPEGHKQLSALLTALIVILEGLLVGTLTGLVGAGGGFLIIPALVVFAGLKMKQAIGTSLLIIAVKSLIGFLGDVSNYEIDWQLLAVFSVLAASGIFIGTQLSKRIDGQKLKVGFGWFVLLMGIGIILKELV